MNEIIANAVIAKILVSEGGVSTDPVDRGGRTAWGQTADWLETYRLPEPKDMQDAADNYLVFLAKTGLDYLCSANDALALATIDCAVNSGAGYAVRLLQIAVGVVPDEVIGPKTRTAIDMCDRGRAARDVWAGHGDACIQNVVRDPALSAVAKTTQLRFLEGHWNRLKAQVFRL